MNKKNLGFKILLGVVLPLAVCIGALTLGGGLKMGIDIRGGHSLIFEIRTNDREIELLNTEKQQAEARLKEALAAGKSAQVAALKAKIERIAGNLNRLESQGGVGNIADRMISILKERIDPQGLRSLEWRPLSNNRIEVRMPAADPRSEQARMAYEKARDNLLRKNIPLRKIRSLCRAPENEKEKIISNLSGSDMKLAESLREVSRAWTVRETSRKTMVAAKEAYETARNTNQSAEKQKKLKDEYDSALDAWQKASGVYNTKFRSVLAGNILRLRLETILSSYIPQGEVEVIKKANKKEYLSRTKRFEEGLASLRQSHPSRVKEIDSVVELYRKWAENRQRLEDPEDLKRMIAKAGVLEFRIAPRHPADPKSLITQDDYVSAIKSLKKDGPDGLKRRNARLRWFKIRGEKDDFPGMVVAPYGGNYYILLFDESGKVMLNDRGPGGWSLTDARRASDEYGRLAIGFSLNAGGARRMGNLTADNKGRQMAILLDDVVYSAPRIQAIISSSGIITGSFTPQEVDDLIRTLQAGSLPARLNPEPVSQSSFGPAIGEVNKQMGIRAAVWGLIAVAGFMFLYYLLAGAIADMALLMNIILVLGAMSMLDAVFTLPGIAGVILTIGIAVDANVLIFERLREEQRKGQSVAMAIKNAYERAFSAIFDANITTMITCLILGWVGTEEVRGFAITLGLGVMFSMFTALVVTRWTFELLMKIGLLKNPIFMLRIIGVPKVNWMSKRHFFWGLSALLIVMGITSLVGQGSDIWGIEFSAGTQAVVKLRDDALIDGKLPDDGLVRTRITATAGQLGFDKLKATARVERRDDPTRVDKFLSAYDTDKDGKIGKVEWRRQRMSAEYFALADADKDGFLDVDEIHALPSTEYQTSTTETRLTRIRETFRKGFGTSLQRRIALEYTLRKGSHVDGLNIDLADSGLTEVQKNDASAYRDLFEDFEGGVLMVLDVTTPQTQEEINRRIGEMRRQPDFGSQQNPTEVVGLKPDADGLCRTFAVFIRSAEGIPATDTRAWNEFSQKESELVDAAMKREEAMEVLNFDAAIAGEAAQLAIVAVVLSWLAIIAYLWLRFGSIQWGLAAVICLIHDVIIVIGLVAASGWLHRSVIGPVLGITDFKIDLAMIAAILTVIGYSVNDTIVVFDRIRENRGKLTTISSDVINSSINQTLGRTLLTSSTTFIVVLIMYVWGGPGIHAFSYALLAGIIFGTYSSIAIASPLLMGFKKALVARTVRTTTE